MNVISRIKGPHLTLLLLSNAGIGCGLCWDWRWPMLELEVSHAGVGGDSCMGDDLYRGIGGGRCS